MTYEIRLTRDAQGDLQSPAAWYRSQKPGLDSEFLARVSTALDRVQHSPLAYPAMDRDLRQLLLRPYPFTVYFTSTDDAHDVQTLRMPAADMPQSCAHLSE